MMKVRADKMIEHKILILLPYYDRPNMVRNALKSVRLASEYYDNWELHFYDDASNVPGEPIVREVMSDLLWKVRFHCLPMTPQEKAGTGGIMGKFFNEIIEKSDAEIGIMLCDDDALYPTYLLNLNRWFNKYPDCKHCYSNCVHYFPRQETFEFRLQHTHSIAMPDLIMGEGICAGNRCDASEVAWRLSCNKEDGAWFRWPCDRCHDYHFYNELYEKSGPCYHTNFISQFKGIHEGQLCRHRWEHVATEKREVMIDTEVYP